MNERSLAFTMWAALVPPGCKAQLNNMMVTVLEGDQLQIKPGGRSTKNKPHLSKTIHPLILSFIQPSIHPPIYSTTHPPTHPSTPLLIHPSIHPSVHPSIHLFTPLVTHSLNYLSIHPSTIQP